MGLHWIGVSAKVGTFSNSKYPGNSQIPEVEGASQLRGLYEGAFLREVLKKNIFWVNKNNNNNNNNKNHRGQQREKVVHTVVSAW